MSGTEVPSTGELTVAIHGSCVSRDTVEVMGGVRLAAYVARQSFISVDAPAQGVKGRLKGLPSAFQQRMVDGDVEGNLVAALARVAAKVDVLLVDLVDERSGVVEVGGGYVTRLAELWQAGGASATAGGRHLAFGSDEHFRLWSAAVPRVLRRLDEFGLAEKVLVLRTPWASTTDDGAALEVPSWMMRPEQADAEYSRYFELLTALGLPVLELPAHLARSPLDHRWGPSPFHYTRAAYEHLADGIRSSVVRRAAII